MVLVLGEIRLKLVHYDTVEGTIWSEHELAPPKSPRDEWRRRNPVSSPLEKPDVAGMANFVLPHEIAYAVLVEIGAGDDLAAGSCGESQFNSMQMRLVRDRAHMRHRGISRSVALPKNVGSTCTRPETSDLYGWAAGQTVSANRSGSCQSGSHVSRPPPPARDHTLQRTRLCARAMTNHDQSSSASKRIRGIR